MTAHNNPNDPIRKRLLTLPSNPGIYRFLDEADQVLYIGKATNLKKRVSSYFHKQNIGAKNKSLIQKIAKIEISVTRSEVEALLLESSLIKSLKPKYNILLRDDKSYPYLHITNHAAFPRVEFTRRKTKPSSDRYFGPYPNIAAVRETLDFIQKTFKLRSCSDSFFNARTRPCLQYQIKRCSAPCTDYISQEDYQQSVSYAIRLLQGKSQHILSELSKKMDVAVKELAFEEAARLRDQIQSLRVIQEQQGMVQRQGDIDVIAIEAQPDFACILCVTVRSGQVLSSQRFFPSLPKIALNKLDDDSLWASVFSSFVSFYYFDTPERIPEIILIDQPIPFKTTLEEGLSELRKKKCHIQTNPRNQIKQRWLDFARNNLHLAITEHQQSTTFNQRRTTELQHCLKLSHPIKRLECFDISHTQGNDTIASCVVFDDKGPRKQDYRLFNITGITPGDDYAAMKQALTRRMLPSKPKPQPDVLLIDGGQGQVNIAKQVLNELGIKNITLLGIAKGPARKPGEEQLIPGDDSGAFMLPKDSPALHLLQHIRDEAHRFAISRHRKKRDKHSLTSSIESIPGIGAKRRAALLRQFGGLRGLAKASLDEIAKTPGISPALAEQIYQHFH